MVRRLAIVVTLVLAVATGCGGSGKDQADATERSTTTSRPTTTTEPVDPTKVPKKITKAYLDAVFKELARIEGDARREIHANKDLSPAAVAKFDAVYTRAFAQTILDQYTESLGPDYIPPSGPDRDVVVKTRSIVSQSPTCLFVEVAEDYRPVLGDEGKVFVRWIALARSTEPNELNPTPWVIDFDGANEDGSRPSDQCAA